jgi:ketosteroid isomerase-like protein
MQQSVEPESPSQEVVVNFLRSMEGDPDAFAAALADDVTWTTPTDLPFAGVYRGKHAVLNDMRAKVAPLFTEPAKISLVSLIGTGPVVVAEFVGKRPTAIGRDYANHYVEIFEIENGLIKAVRQYMDTQHFITRCYE